MDDIWQDKSEFKENTMPKKYWITSKILLKIWKQIEHPDSRIALDVLLWDLRIAPKWSPSTYALKVPRTQKFLQAKALQMFKCLNISNEKAKCRIYNYNQVNQLLKCRKSYIYNIIYYLQSLLTHLFLCVYVLMSRWYIKLNYGSMDTKQEDQE